MIFMIAAQALSSQPWRLPHRSSGMALENAVAGIYLALERLGKVVLLLAFMWAVPGRPAVLGAGARNRTDGAVAFRP